MGRVRADIESFRIMDIGIAIAEPPDQIVRFSKRELVLKVGIDGGMTFGLKYVGSLRLIEVDSELDARAGRLNLTPVHHRVSPIAVRVAVGDGAVRRSQLEDV